ncbi:Cof-type HAD-IIB family hydrolase [Limosilactobacillus fermentum]|uniref:Cof-type HAD-IIB family hydrolase n=1 Tax=Limosilactobacillus fermentum TaxID=1613 RepID=UPI003BA0CC90
MTIKAIAVDMDGTFLNSQSDYDHDYFAKVYDLMVAKGVQFVVASGNPHYQLEDRFPTVKDQLAFVAENGVELIDHGELVYCGKVAMEMVERVNALHQAIAESHFIISAYDTAYTFKDEDPAFVEHAIKHYPHMKRIDSLSEVDDKVTKMMMDVPKERTHELQAKINADFAGVLEAVSSGYGNLDIIVTGMDKSTGLKELVKRHGWDPADLVAFGDGQNDLSMLNYVGQSYGMANGDPRVLAATRFTAPTNDENGVLKTIEKLLTD